MANYTENELAKDLENQEYKFGFVTDIETDTVPIGLNEDIIRLISNKKNEPEWLLEHRLKAFAIWKTMTEPEWAHVHYTKPDFQAIAYYSAPKQTKKYESWDDVDPEMKATMAKLGISLEEQQRLTGVAVDFVAGKVPAVIMLYSSDPRAFTHVTTESRSSRYSSTMRFAIFSTTKLRHSLSRTSRNVSQDTVSPNLTRPSGIWGPLPPSRSFSKSSITSSNST
jgi:hypothetical protein